MERAGRQRTSRSRAETTAAAEVLLIVAGEPPPTFGAAAATGRLLAAGRSGGFRFHHVNIIDPAGTSNMGKLVLTNVALALKHYAQVTAVLVQRRDIAAIYMLIGFVNAPAFWRDIGFVILARLFRKPTILHAHDSIIEEFCHTHAWPTRRAVRWALHGARAVPVLCAGVGAAMQRVAPHTRVVVVPNGLDLEPTGGRQRPAGAVPVVLYVSQLSREKGFWTALHIAALARRQGVEARFEFAGNWKSPEDEPLARSWVAQNGLGSTVSIHGPVSEQRKSELLRNADVFLFPTRLRHEGQPLVILEAMAAGLPVISTDIGCIRDTVRHGVTGFVVQPDDTDSMLETLELLLHDEELRRTTGAAARERYLAHYTERAFIDRMLALLGSAAPSVLPDPAPSGRP